MKGPEQWSSFISATIRLVSAKVRSLNVFSGVACTVYASVGCNFMFRCAHCSDVHVLLSKRVRICGV